MTKRLTAARTPRDHRGMGRILLAVGLCLVFASPALAQTPDSKELARRHFKMGMAAFTLERYDAAIKSSGAGSLAEPEPVFLYNLGQAYRLSKRPEQAMNYYRKYLTMMPNATNRVEVENRLEAMRKLLAQQNSPPQT